MCRVLRVHHARLWWSVSRQKHRNVVERVFNAASKSGITHALPQGTHHPFFVSLTMHPGDMPQASRRKAAYCRRFAGKKHQALLLNPWPVLLIESYGDKCLAYLLRLIRRQRGFCRHPLKRFHLVELSHGCSPMLRSVTRCHSVVHAVPSSPRIPYHLVYKDQDRAAYAERQRVVAVSAGAARRQFITRAHRPSRLVLRFHTVRPSAGLFPPSPRWSSSCSLSRQGAQPLLAAPLSPPV